MLGPLAQLAPPALRPTLLAPPAGPASAASAANRARVLKRDQNRPKTEHTSRSQKCANTNDGKGKPKREPTHHPKTSRPPLEEVTDATETTGIIGS